MAEADQPFRRVESRQTTSIEQCEVTNDHFVQVDGQTFAGTHLLLDLWGSQHLQNREFIERILREAVVAAGAELLHLHVHRFASGGGISGVAVLAESHISVHTWPERGYAALDIFMCGKARPERAARVIQEAFEPTKAILRQHRRGLVEDD